MPTKSPYTLGPGELRIDDTVIEISGSEEIGIPNLDIESDSIRDYVKDNLVFRTSDSMEFECSLNLNKFMLYKLTGLYDWVVNYCPNRRVSHLIKHGKTKRIRYKNFRRGLKLLNKEMEKYS